MCLDLQYSASHLLLPLGTLSKYPSGFPFLSLVSPAALPVLACARSRGCLHLLGRRLGFQAQADWLFCFYLCDCFLTRILCTGSVCKMHSGLAWSPTPKHMVGTRQVAWSPRLENGAEAYRLNLSHPMALLSTTGRTEAVVLSAEVIYSLDPHRGKQRKVGGGRQFLAVFSFHPKGRMGAQ